MNQKNLVLNLLDTNKFIKLNNLKEVYDPVYFVRDNLPTPNGLLSNDIFGITINDRKNRYAYIDLKAQFIHPLVYIIMTRMDRRINEIIAEQGSFKIDENGHIVAAENGNTGIKWLIKNLDKIKFKSTDSNKRDINIKFVEKMIKDKLAVIDKWIVIPAGFRDANTADGKFGVGEINKLYSKLIISSNSLSDLIDYGMDMNGATVYRTQSLLVAIYDWFTREPNLAKKGGITARAGMSKTTDYAVRLVITCPDVNVESVDDLECDLYTASVPLAATAVAFYPFNIFNMKLIIRRFFEDNKAMYNGEPVRLKSIDGQFTDYILKQELDRFIKGFANRLVPVSVETEDGKIIHPKIRYKTEDGRVISRKLLWIDIIFMACSESVKNRHITITRYPIESHFGQFATKVSISSTKHTEKSIIVDRLGKFSRYPIINEEDIGTNTSNMFIDTLRFSNLHLIPIGGDYDGDQVTVKGVYTDEANEEIRSYIHSKKYLIGLTGTNSRQAKDEAIHAVYALTYTSEKLQPMQF
jgi:hypothetical protein